MALEGPNGEVYSEGLSRLREQISSTQSCADVCLICLENIASDAAVWTCRKSCHVLLHLICAQAWGRQQLQSAAALARASAEQPDLCAPPAAFIHSTGPCTCTEPSQSICALQYLLL